jgi:hypothetical protein
MTGGRWMHDRSDRPTFACPREPHARQGRSDPILITVYETGRAMNRKELVNRYKQIPRPMGVYRITNTKNGRVFIGAAKDLPGIINSNKYQLKIGRHSNAELQKDYDLYGEESFSYDILDYLEPNDDVKYDHAKDLKTLEEMWLEKLQPFDDKGYNARKQ